MEKPIRWEYNEDTDSMEPVYANGDELTDQEEYERQQFENLRREEELKDAFDRMGNDGC